MSLGPSADAKHTHNLKRVEELSNSAFGSAPRGRVAPAAEDTPPNGDFAVSTSTPSCTPLKKPSTTAEPYEDTSSWQRHKEEIIQQLLAK